MEALAKEIMESVLGSMRSGVNLGDKTEEEIRKEVLRLKDEGKKANDIGKQIGAYLMKCKDDDALDRLDRVLCEEFSSYAKEKREMKSAKAI